MSCAAPDRTSFKSDDPSPTAPRTGKRSTSPSVRVVVPVAVVLRRLRSRTPTRVRRLDPREVRDGERLELDSRPSDAIALAVRVQAPIFVSESVMERAGVTPDEEIDLDAITPEEEEQLAPYRDFIEGLDLGDLGE